LEQPDISPKQIDQVHLLLQVFLFNRNLTYFPIIFG